MIVYIYNKETNQKLNVYKNVTTVTSTKNFFQLVREDNVIAVDKDNIKLVVYGF